MEEIKKNVPEANNRSQELCRRVVTTESFIAEAKEIYGDKYDYSKVDYKNREHQVIVGCPVHGDFKIFAREHLDGKGCPKCAKGEKFIKKLQTKFGNKFLLDNFVYENSTLPVELICPIHGSFSRLPNVILASKCGCPECGNELSRQLQEQSHAEAEAKKMEVKRQKEEGCRKALLEWYKEWGEVVEKSRRTIELWPNGCLKFSAQVKGRSIINPVDAYRSLVDQYIDVIRSGGKNKIDVIGLKPLREDEVNKLTNYRHGDTYYLVLGDAASQKVIDYVAAVYKLDEEQLCCNLSHRGCHVSFIDGNLLIRKERSPFCTFTNNAENLFNTLREQGINEWNNMKVYVCPFEDILYVTEDIKMESARFSNDVTKWFFIPFDERCNANVIKYGCDVYYHLM